jgi:hypothetical protein
MKILLKSFRPFFICLVLCAFCKNTYAADTLSFRSFTPQKLADAPVAEKRIKFTTEWSFKFTNMTSSKVNALYFESVQPVLEFINISPFTMKLNTKPDKKKWLLAGATINPGDEIVITGSGDKKGMKISKWFWQIGSDRIGPQNKNLLPAKMKIFLPMPNISNVGEELFKNKGFPGGMVIGIPQKNKSLKLAWLKSGKWKDVQNTLKDNSGYHIGNPAGLDKFTDKQPVVGLQKSLPPKRFNNRLFAEAVTLRFNIVASELGRTPYGFGDLIFDDGGMNQLNGMSIKEISAKTDTVLTYWPTTPTSFYNILYDVLHRINCAFDGPIDTIGFGAYTSLTGVKTLTEVPFLTLQRKSSPIKIIPNNSDDSETETVLLVQNYPNPFNPVTQIEFELPVDAIVSVVVYDLLGREIQKLAESQEFLSGINELEFDGKNLPAGIYFYRITVQDMNNYEILFQTTRKMVLNR